MALKGSSITFSNRVETLYDNLRDDLFNGENPFTQRIVMVPSPAMRSWLTLRLADDIGISGGVEVRFLEQGLNQIYELLCREDVRLKSPDSLSLALKIEIALTDACAAGDDILRQPLADYLGEEAATLKSCKRITALSQKLAHLFMQYGRYGAGMLEEWKKEGGDWQQQLWSRLFYPEGYRCLYDKLESFVAEAPKRPLQVHLFANSFLSALQQRFLQKAADKIPVFTYALSPCQAFWSDVFSDKERIAIKKKWEGKSARPEQIEELDSYLRDRNPLLANFGRLGREMARLLEEQQFYESREGYTVHAAVAELPQYEDFPHEDFHLENSEPFSVLQALKADIAMLRNGADSTPIEFADDDSIQVHISSSRRREIENLYNTLTAMIDSRKGELSPGEIVVMAPDIADYSPYIQTLFDSGESLLDCRIMDLKAPGQSPMIQGFLKFIALPYSRWDAASILEIIDVAAFRKSRRLSSDDINLIRGWICDTQIRWGCDAAHRDELLMLRNCKQGMQEKSEAGTWEEGIAKLVAAATEAGAEGERQNVAFDLSKAAALGAFAYTLRAIRHDLKPITNGTKLTIEEWVLYLEALVETYFDDDKQEGGMVLADSLATLRRAGGEVKEELFPFSSAKKQLEELLCKEESCYRENQLHAIRFCSMLPMRAVPAKVVVLLGLHEGSFPKRDLISSLNMMATNSLADYCPSQRDYDRYLFLEMLLSARRHLILSYVGYSESDGKERPPALLITELMQYLDSSYLVGGALPSEHCLIKHPFNSFDKAYFSKETKAAALSRRRYQAASAHYTKPKRAPSPFIASFAITDEVSEEGDYTVDARQLAAHGRNPLKSYFNQTLGLYLESLEREELKNEEDFTLSALDSSIIAKETLKKPFEDVIDDADKRGILPLGLFKGISVEKLEKKSAELTEPLHQLGLSGSDLFDIELDRRCHNAVQESETVWRFPALSVGTATVTGKILNATTKGIVAYQSDIPKESLIAWPQLLLYNALIEQQSLSWEPRLLLIKKGKHAVKNAGNAAARFLLEDYINYYRLSLKNPSPLLPEWLPALLDGDRDQLQECINAAIADNLYNRYIEWCWRGGRCDGKAILDNWGAIAQKIYNIPYLLWHPEKAEEER